ncbi:MAG: protease pro-enzyme activation domain-containing protein, partial [Acidimicrobiales bacterium]
MVTTVVALTCLATPATVLGVTVASGATPALASGWVRNAGSVPALPGGTRRLGALAGTTALSADVVLAPRSPAALSAFDTAVSTPGSPDFRHYLAPGAFARQFGPTDATVASVRQWLSGRGLRVGPTASDGLLVPVSGDAAQLGQAFGVGLEQYRLPSGRVVHAPSAGPLVPSALAPAVDGVVGLDDVARPVPEMARPAAAPAPPADRATGATPHAAGATPHATGPTPSAGCQNTINSGRASAGALTADELAQAYSFDSLYPGTEGAGVTVGVYELEPYLVSDINAFEACYSISTVVTAKPVDQSLASVNDSPGQGEAALDIEMVAAMAPDATVDVYDGPNGGTGPLDTYAAMVNQDAVSVISTSWGQCEAQTSPVVAQAEAALFAQAVGQGQTITAAAGDEGSEDCYFFPSSTDTRLEVDDPASQPGVTGVGATTLSALGPAPTESVWNAGLFEGTSGGGLSSTWTLPSWQLGPGVQNPYTKARDSFTGTSPCPDSSAAGTSSCREVPDVSSDGDPATGFAVYCSCFAGWAKIGGTSMASPLWAALAALADDTTPSPSRVGFMNPALYQAQCQSDDAFNDVTTGTDQPAGSVPSDPPHSPVGPYYPATPGYDLASGLGTPVAPTVVSALRAPPTGVCPEVTGMSVTQGPATGGTVLTLSGVGLSGVTQVDVGNANPATIESVGSGSVTVLTPPSPTGGWATAEVLVKSANDVLGYDGSMPFTYTGPKGYWTVASDGGIFAFGQMGFYGSMGGTHLNKPIVGMASTPSSKGYWLVASDGGIFAFGDASFWGSTGAIKLNQPIVGMAPTPDGRGYWLVASDGGIFAFGDAGFYGSTGNVHLNQPIVGMASTPDGGGYWLVAADGGIFSFGDAAFFGSTGAITLNKPIVAMATTPDGGGYWLVAADGGIFAFGDAAFEGSTGDMKLNKPIVGMIATPDGHGYWLVASDGGIFAFGGVDGGFFGSMGGTPLQKPMVGMGAA